MIHLVVNDMFLLENKKRFARVSAYYGIRFEEFYMPVHKHGSLELMYVSSGTCSVLIEGEEITLDKNRLILIGQDVSHRLTVEKGRPATVFCVEFMISENKSGIDLYELKQNCDEFDAMLQFERNYMVLTGNDKIGFAVKDIIAEQEKGQKKCDYLCSLLLAKMLIELARCYEGQRQTSGIVHLNRAKTYIEQNYAFDINVDSVAQSAGVHPAYLQSLFREAFSCGIKTYINHLRMEKARFLLRNTRASVSQIAFETGFNSRQHFGYTFEKASGLSPMQYRKLKGLVFEVDTKTFKQTK